MMGDDRGEYDSEKPAHPVKLDDFYIGQFPVTQQMWKAVMGNDNNPSYYLGDDRPVETVSWKDCQVFLKKLQQVSDKKYRLPTEAEWEYAARGGQHQAPFLYAGSDHLKEVGWYRQTSHRETKEVGQLQPNQLGIYDMSGNVWEWCQDWYNKKYYQQCHKKGTVKNPVGPANGSDRVLRGGSWNGGAQFCRSSYRLRFVPDSRNRHIGFRLVLVPS